MRFLRFARELSLHFWKRGFQVIPTKTTTIVINRTILYTFFVFIFWSVEFLALDDLHPVTFRGLCTLQQSYYWWKKDNGCVFYTNAMLVEKLCTSTAWCSTSVQVSDFLFCNGKSPCLDLLSGYALFGSRCSFRSDVNLFLLHNLPFYLCTFSSREPFQLQSRKTNAIFVWARTLSVGEGVSTSW